MRSGRRPDDTSSIVVCFSNGDAYVESDAVLTIAQGLDGPLSAIGNFGMLLPTPIRDAAYHVVAENRFRFGEYDSCRMDYDGEYDNRFVPDP